jgi:hypothetical protein
MLQKLTDEIAECYRHARECHERAKQSHDPATKEDLFNMERRWLSLAHNLSGADDTGFPNGDRENPCDEPLAREREPIERVRP